MGQIEIVPVESKKQLKQFIKFQYSLYKHEPNWVPYLLLERYKFFNPNKNPFFNHTDMQSYLAYRDGKLVGRISGIVNHLHNKYHNEKAGFFGFFECINDEEVASALFKEAEQYVKNQGMEIIRGPMNPSTNHEIGLLMDAYDQPPVLMMTYNFPYYVGLIEKSGFTKAKDVYALKIEEPDLKIYEKLKRVNKILRKRNNVTLRSINMNDFDQEVQRVKDIYNDAWSLNWGFVPMTDEEIEYMAQDIRQLVEPELVLFAEIDGVPAGFSLSLPNVNEIMIHIRNGKLFPTGIFKFLKYKNSVTGLRVITLGVKKKYEHLGLGALFYMETIERGLKLGYNWAEASWILEDNMKMIRPLMDLGASVYKTYRIYEKIL